MSRPSLFAGALAVGAAAASGQATAQDAGGVVHTARISSSMEANDNYSLSEDSPGDSFIWTNTLTLGMSSITPVDSFSGTVAGDLRFAELPAGADSGTDLDNGTVNLDYARQVSDNSLSLNFSANDADVEFLDPLRSFNDDGSFDDTRGTGRRTLMRGGVALTLNGDGPVRFAFSANASETNFYDTTDEGLVDREFQEVSAMIGADVTDTAEIYLEGSAYNRKRGNGNDSDSATLRLGAKADVSPVTVLDANIGYQRVNVDDEDGTSETNEGVVAGLTLTRALPNGTIYTRIDSSYYEGGQEASMLVGREFELPAGSFAGEIGATVTDASDANPVFNLAYNTGTPTSQFRVVLNQSVAVNDDLNDRLNLNLTTSYTHLVNPTSSFTLSALAGRRQDLQTEFEDESLTRFTLTAQYDQTITRDWAVSTGVRHRTRLEDSAGDSHSNAVFLTLTRSFGAQR
ncbi:hypothetical protein [Poseidonocella sp. HB161398]|uniref:hypothetical protein n=1 Tax=Poseidonocella sp. HB161398 TaxID=2320855 RepID=UPI0011083F6A|nr:hypothetical protein [Poseidonocella sp. HB161398]